MPEHIWRHLRPLSRAAISERVTKGNIHDRSALGALGKYGLQVVQDTEERIERYRFFEWTGHEEGCNGMLNLMLRLIDMLIEGNAGE